MFRPGRPFRGNFGARAIDTRFTTAEPRGKRAWRETRPRPTATTSPTRRRHATEPRAAFCSNPWPRFVQISIRFLTKSQAAFGPNPMPLIGEIPGRFCVKFQAAFGTPPGRRKLIAHKMAKRVTKKTTIFQTFVRQILKSRPHAAPRPRYLPGRYRGRAAARGLLNGACGASGAI